MKIRHNLTSPKNRDFFSLFYPAIAPMRGVGIAAQIASAATEAIIVYFLVVTRTNSVFTAIFSAVLAVAIIEMGGRKFVQVLTRVVVWKEWETTWHKILAAFIFTVTISIFSASFFLSVQGVSLSIAHDRGTLDTSGIQAAQAAEIQAVHEQADRIEKAAQAAAQAEADRVGGVIREYETKAKKGHRWAKTHAQKHGRKLAQMQAQAARERKARAEKLAADIERIRAKYAAQATQAAQEHGKAEEEGKARAAAFSALLRTIAGLAVVLAYVCIIIVEVYHRGSERKHETEEVTSQWDRICRAMGKRWGRVVERIADWLEPETLPETQAGGIGFFRDPEVAKLAASAARQRAKAYENKTPTKNNIDKAEKWRKVSEQITAITRTDPNT